MTAPSFQKRQPETGRPLTSFPPSGLVSLEQVLGCCLSMLVAAVRRQAVFFSLLIGCDNNSTSSAFACFSSQLCLLNWAPRKATSANSTQLSSAQSHLTNYGGYLLQVPTPSAWPRGLERTWTANPFDSAAKQFLHLAGGESAPNGPASPPSQPAWIADGCLSLSLCLRSPTFLPTQGSAGSHLSSQRRNCARA